MAKNTGKVREKSGNFVSPEKWEPWISISLDPMIIRLSPTGGIFDANITIIGNFVLKTKTRLKFNSNLCQLRRVIRKTRI